MNSDLGTVVQWLLFGLITAVFVYTRFVGKTSPDDAKRLVAEGARLVDVRSSAEFASGHIDGAVNIPVDQLPGRVAEVGPKEGPVVVYCRSGARSARAASILKAAGYTRVSDLGAMSRW